MNIIQWGFNKALINVKSQMRLSNLDKSNIPINTMTTFPKGITYFDQVIFHL